MGNLALNKFESNFSKFLSQPNLYAEETNLIGTDSEWGTFENVKDYIKSHDVNWRSEFLHISTLHIACRFGHILLIRQLILEGSDINAKGIGEETQLIKSVGFSHHEVVYFLVNNNANVNDKNLQDWSVLYKADYHGDSFLTKLLLDHGALVDLQNKRKRKLRFIHQLSSQIQF